MLDNKRNQITKLYSDSTILVYEGHRTSGKDEVGKFYANLPKSSHKVTSLDVQPINKSMTKDIVSVLIKGIAK